MRIHNNSFQRSANISLVAGSIWRKPGISRIEIARKLNLYRSTVSNIIQILLDNGVVYEAETGEGTSGGGRKPVLLRMNEKFGCVLGIELQPSGYRAAVVGISGRILGDGNGDIPPGPLPVGLGHVLRTMQPKIESLGMPLLGVCVGMPGIIDPDDGVVLVSEPFGLKDFPFYRDISERYPVPVIVENDANCCAWGLLTANREDRLEDFICLFSKIRECGSGRHGGPGVGLGVATDGKIYYGKNYGAGEFASVFLEPSSEGQFGVPFDGLFNPAANRESFRDFTAELFRSLLPVVTVLDPEALFVCGELCDHEAAVREILAECVPGFLSVLGRTNCRLEFSSNGGNDVALGAAAMFLQKLFSVPELSGIEKRLQFDWDDAFSLASHRDPFVFSPPS